MQYTSDTIVLEPITCDQVVMPEENRYYDATMQYLKVSGRGNNSPTFDIDRIMTQYAKNRGDVVRLTLPAAVYTKWRGPQIQVPTLWEMGGLNRGGIGRPSWCVIPGSVTGGRVDRTNVCQVRYPTPDKTVYPSGRHALVVTQPETMFIIAQRAGNMTVCLVYRVDEVLPWPKLENFPAIPDKPYVALNCSLVGIRQITGGDILGWVHPTRMDDESKEGMARLVRLAQEKLRTPALTPCNIELFWDAAPNSTDKNVHASPEGTDVTTYTPDAEDFVAEVIARIGEYRKLLTGTTLPSRSHPIPASVSYELEEDGQLQINVEVPSAIEGNDPFAVAAYLQGPLPASLIAEPTLSWGCTTAEDLIAKCGEATVVSRNIFTFC